MKAKGTKSVATRIPYESYIDLLDEAQSKGMTMNDYLAWRLFRKPDTSVNEGRIKVLQDDLSTKDKMIESLKKELSEVSSSISSIERDICERRITSILTDITLAIRSNSTSGSVPLIADIGRIMKSVGFNPESVK